MKLTLTGIDITIASSATARLPASKKQKAKGETCIESPFAFCFCRLLSYQGVGEMATTACTA